MRRVLASCALVVTAVCAAPTAPHALAAAASPSPSATAGKAAPDPKRVTFGIQPASASDKDTRPFFTYNVSPGVSLDDHVAVVNYSLQPVTLSVYGTDAFNLPDGGFALKTAADKPVDVGSWISLPDSAKKISLPGRATATSNPPVAVIPFHFQVPANAEPGDHAAGVVAVLSTVAGQKDGTDVRLDQRVGTRMYVRVSGDLHAKLAVENIHVSWHGSVNPLGTGKATVRYTVHNIGNVKLGARQAVQVKGLFGVKASAKAVPDMPLLFPGNSATYSEEVTGVFPTLHAKAVVTLLPLHLQTDADPPLPRVEGSQGFWDIPWVLLAVLILLAAAGRVRWMRRRRPKTPTPAQPPVAVAPTPVPVPAGGSDGTPSGPSPEPVS